jgi:1,4-dihydroxy-2-naphthoate octaprenyltransferase
MATAGSAYVQAETVSSAAWWSSVPMGLLAIAILVANNLRDIPTDEAAGRRTLAVRLGERRTRTTYRAVVAASFAAVALGAVVEALDDGRGLPALALLAFGSIPSAARPLREVGHARGRALITVLVGTAVLQVVFGALLAIGLWIS